MSVRISPETACARDENLRPLELSAGHYLTQFQFPVAIAPGFLERTRGQKLRALSRHSKRRGCQRRRLPYLLRRGRLDGSPVWCRRGRLRARRLACFETLTLPEALEMRTSSPTSFAEMEPLAVLSCASRSIFSTRMTPEAACTFTGPRTPRTVCAPAATLVLTSCHEEPGWCKRWKGAADWIILSQCGWNRLFARWRICNNLIQAFPRVPKPIPKRAHRHARTLYRPRSP